MLLFLSLIVSAPENGTIIHAVSLPDKSTGLASIFGPHAYHLGYAEGVLRINIPDISTPWSCFPHSCHTSNIVSRKPLSPVAQGGTSCKSLFQVITAAGRELHELCTGSQSCCLQVEPAALLAFHWLEQVTWSCQTSEVAWKAILPVTQRRNGMFVTFCLHESNFKECRQTPPVLYFLMSCASYMIILYLHH